MQDSQMELLAFSESWECEMDVDLMESLLVNLLDNAIKASKPGSVIELHGEKGASGFEISEKEFRRKEIPRLRNGLYVVDKPGAGRPEALAWVWRSARKSPRFTGRTL